MTDNAEFIRSIYKAFERGDVKAILDRLDPAVEWISYSDPKTIPWGGKRRGVPGAASFFQAFADNVDFEVFELYQILASGDHVTALGRTRAHFKKAGGGNLRHGMGACVHDQERQGRAPPGIQRHRRDRACLRGLKLELRRGSQ